MSPKILRTFCKVLRFSGLAQRVRIAAPGVCFGSCGALHPAGRCPNSSSLFLPLAAVVAVADFLQSPPFQWSRAASTGCSLVCLINSTTPRREIHHAGALCCVFLFQRCIWVGRHILLFRRLFCIARPCIKGLFCIKCISFCIGQTQQHLFHLLFIRTAAR